MKNKLNVLHLITGLGCGGAEKMVYQLSKYANKDKFNIYVVSLGPQTDYFYPLIKSLQVKVKVDVLDMHRNPISFLSSINKINNILKTNKIDLIHTHLFHAMAMGCVIKIFNRRVQLVWTSHIDKITSIMKSLIIFLFRPIRDHDILLQNHFNQWYTCTEFSTIHNFVDLPSSDLSSKKFDDFTFITVGRLEKQKNYESLIEAFANNGCNSKLLIIGVGSLFDKLKNKIDELGLSNRILLLGQRSDIYKLMLKSHCYILSSRWEGFPLTLLEAGSAQLPILATRIEATKDIINGETGTLVELDHLSTGMNKIINNYESSVKLADNFYQKILKDFSRVSCIEKHEEVYERVLMPNKSSINNYM